MKRKLILLFCLLFTFTICLWSSAAVKAKVEADGTIAVLDATYNVTSTISNKEIGYGITHIKDVGLSSATELNNYDSNGPKGEKVPQVVNVLSIPSNEAVRVIDWTYMSSNGWTKQTVVKMAENFELYNPGWKVVAGTNADFFDINGLAALPYQPTGYTVSNGEVYRPYAGGISDTAIGFKNDGSDYPFIGGKPVEVTGHKLQILDADGNITKEFDVEYFNENPQNDGIAVWFTYPVMVGDSRSNVAITTPATNSYLITVPNRCLAMSSNCVYGKGIINQVNTEMTLNLGQFGISTENEEVKSYLTEGTSIRIQQNVTGVYAECDNILGSGAPLVVDGEAHQNGEGMTWDRHPRTCVGVKADGSIILMVIDGRQQADNMYGMSYSEQSAAMLYYGAVEAYNVDGGGSSTMIIRNGYGGFDVMNSPSDGNERRDSNAILVVVPEITMKIDEVFDDSIDFSYVSPSKEITMSNLEIAINGETREFDGQVFSWDGLNSETTYALNYTYDINYKSSTIEGIKGKINFTTGKTKPYPINYYYEETDDAYNISFDLCNSGPVSMLYVKVDGKMSIMPIYSRSIKIAKSRVTDISTLTLTVEYNMGALPNKNSRDIYTVMSKEAYLANPPLHNVSYILNGGTLPTNSISTYPETKTTLLPIPTKDYYIFEGWYYQNEKYTEIPANFAKDITLTARWTKTVYTITYNVDGGILTNDVKNTYTNGETITLPTPTKDGFTFLGWYSNDVKITEIASTSFGDLTLNAKWEKINETRKGCGCKKNSSLVFTLISFVTLFTFVLRKKK